jgi:hypothetical protein
MPGKPAESLRRLLEKGLSQNDDSVIEELISERYVHHDAPIPIRGPEGVQAAGRVVQDRLPRPQGQG